MVAFTSFVRVEVRANGVSWSRESLRPHAETQTKKNRGYRTTKDLWTASDTTSPGGQEQCSCGGDDAGDRLWSIAKWVYLGIATLTVSNPDPPTTRVLYTQLGLSTTKKLSSKYHSQEGRRLQAHAFQPGILNPTPGAPAAASGDAPSTVSRQFIRSMILCAMILGAKILECMTGAATPPALPTGNPSAPASGSAGQPSRFIRIYPEIEAAANALNALFPA